jgi:limonene-1,2-epoxide hydrolase
LEQAAEAQVVGKTIQADFYVTDGATWRLKEMLENCGISETNGSGQTKSLREMISEAPGKQLFVKLRHELSQDGKRVFHRLDSTAAC